MQDANELVDPDGPSKIDSRSRLHEQSRKLPEHERHQNPLKNRIVLMFECDEKHLDEGVAEHYSSEEDELELERVDAQEGGADRKRAVSDSPEGGADGKEAITGGQEGGADVKTEVSEIASGADASSNLKGEKGANLGSKLKRKIKWKVKSVAKKFKKAETPLDSLKQRAGGEKSWPFTRRRIRNPKIWSMMTRLNSLYGKCGDNNYSQLQILEFLIELESTYEPFVWLAWEDGNKLGDEEKKFELERLSKHVVKHLTASDIDKICGPFNAEKEMEKERKERGAYRMSYFGPVSSWKP
ncbi:hypothetical protein HDV00_005173 [Rhizophlyctis rosea]|nr:hypothetical protein HDV00_005173 [Rhizophlyctis rosea]